MKIRHKIIARMLLDGKKHEEAKAREIALFEQMEVKDVLYTKENGDFYLVAEKTLMVTAEFKLASTQRKRRAHK